MNSTLGRFGVVVIWRPIGRVFMRFSPRSLCYMELLHFSVSPGIRNKASEAQSLLCLPEVSGSQRYPWIGSYWRRFGVLYTYVLISPLIDSS